MTTLNHTGRAEELFVSERNVFLDKIKYCLSKSKENLLIIAPFIKINALDKLISDCKSKITIITTWKLRDMQFGSSELDLYNYCKKNNIYLYINQKIHLKAFIVDYEKCVFGSANISFPGLAITENYNYELAKEIKKLDVNTLLYFKKILKESILVNDRIYNQFKAELDKLKSIPDIEEINLNKLRQDPEFLISALPMSLDIEEFYKTYSGGFVGSKEKIQCALHDIALYDIPINLSKKEFFELLKKRFFESKFIIKLLKVIDRNGMYFGRVKEWIQKNCQDVPVPSRRSLTGNIQVLYKWIAELSEGKYEVDRPRYSERIFRVD
jgi:hypothetical protein